jgi:hypothetical protein
MLQSCKPCLQQLDWMNPPGGGGGEDQKVLCKITWYNHPSNTLDKMWWGCPFVFGPFLWIKVSVGWGHAQRGHGTCFCTSVGK